MDRRQRTLLSLPGFSKMPMQPQEKRRRRISNESSSGSIDSLDLEVSENMDQEEASRRKKARRSWIDSWGVTFEWAIFDKKEGRIFCTICQKVKNCKSEYGTIGSINIQLSAIKHHAETKGHKWAAYAQGYGQRALADGIKKQHANVDSSVLNAFRTAYFLAKHDIAFLKFAPMLTFLKGCGTENLPVDLYHNDKAAATFVSFIANSICKETIQRLKESSVFGIYVDESTDISVVEHLIVYGSYMWKHSPYASFLGLIEVEDKTAKGLHVALKQFFVSHEIDETKMVSFGSDGASVMTGKGKGVATLLKQSIPFLTSIHCVAHRTHLCASDALKQCEFARKIDSTLNEIGFFLKKSSSRILKLTKLEQEFDCKTLHMKRIHNIRWLSRHKVIATVCEVIEPLLEFLRVEDRSLYEIVSKFEFIYCIHFLGDILDHIAHLSYVFQNHFVDITSVSGLVNVTMGMIQMEFLNDPLLDINAWNYDSRGFPLIPDYGSANGHLAELRSAIKGDMFRGAVIQRCPIGSDLIVAIDFQKEYCTLILDSLKERFEDNTILSDLKILCPSSFPPGQLLKSFGGEELDSLVKFYGNPVIRNGKSFDSLIDGRCLKKEFQVFKVQAASDWKTWPLKDIWTNVSCTEALRTKYPMMLQLSEVAMVQCASTAICERGFSCQNMIKTRYRNQLATPNLAALMHISIEGPSVEDFDFTESIEEWGNVARTSRHIYGTLQH